MFGISLLSGHRHQLRVGLRICDTHIALSVRDRNGCQLFERDRDASQPLAKQIEQLAGRDLKGAQCQLLLPPAYYEIQQIERPNVPDDELAQALPWAVKELSSVAANDLVVDYFDLAAMPTGANRLNVVCASAKRLRPLVDAVADTGMQLQGITIEEMALLSTVSERAEASLLALAIPGEEMLLTIVMNKQLYFTRRLLGYSKLHTLPLEQLAEGMLDSLSLEMQRSMDYFESQLRQPPVKKINLLLAEQLLMPVSRGLGQSFFIPIEAAELVEQGEPSAGLRARLADGACQLLGAGA